MRCATRTSPIRPSCACRCRRCSTRRFADKLAGRIDPDKRVPLPPAPAPGSDTVYLTVVDRDRTAVSLINSLYSQLRHRHLHREDRHHAAQPRRRLRGRSRPSQHVRAGQAADAHDHSGARVARRPLRHVRSASWARTTSRWATCRSSPTWSTTAWTCRRRSMRRAPFFEGERDRGRARRAGGDGRRAEGARARRRRCAPAPLRRRPGDPHRLGARRADRRLRSAQGRLRARVLRAAYREPNGSAQGRRRSTPPHRPHMASAGSARRRSRVCGACWAVAISWARKGAEGLAARRRRRLAAAAAGATGDEGPALGARVRGTVASLASAGMCRGRTTRDR